MNSMLGTAESLGVEPTGQQELKTKIKTVVEIFAEKNKNLVENTAKSLQGLRELVPDLPNLLQDVNTKIFVVMAPATAINTTQNNFCMKPTAL